MKLTRFERTLDTIGLSVVGAAAGGLLYIAVMSGFILYQLTVGG